MNGSWVVGKATSQTDTASLAKLKLNINACVAQSVEQFIRNERVAGSNPVTSSKEKPRKYVVSEVSFLCLIRFSFEMKMERHTELALKKSPPKCIESN